MPSFELVGPVVGQVLIKLDLVSSWQFCCREAWATSGWLCQSSGGGLDGLVISSDLDGPTVIPTYWEYDGMWQKSGYQNPLEFQWAIMGKVVYIDIAYLDFVICSLSEQLLIYGIDSDTRQTKVFSHLGSFVTALQTLYECLFCRDCNFTLFEFRED